MARQQPIASIDWCKEPNDDRERRVRLAMIRRAEDRFSSPLFQDNDWMQEMALTALAGDLDPIASDLVEAIARRRAARNERSELKRTAENDRLLALAIADIDAEDGSNSA